MRPPRLARLLIAVSAPSDQRGDLLANLDDEWRAHVVGRGEAFARQWYWRQARSSVVPLLRRRISLAHPEVAFAGVGEDLRHSLRLLAQAPGFSLTAVAALALGIGATAATFSVVSAVLLKPLAYRESDRLVVIMHRRSNPVSPANFMDWREQADLFAEMNAAEYWTANLGGHGEPEKIYALRTSSGLLPMLGVAPAIGRTLGRTTAREVVIADSLWQRRYGADPSIIGRAVTLDGEAFTIVGVMPPGFRFAPFWATRAEIWAPLAFDPRTNLRERSSLRVFARLKAGVTVAQAQSQITAITARLEQQYPGTNRNVTVTPLMEMVVGNVEQPLFLLVAAVGFVLIIACANVAHMLLVRASAREKEVAVRLALGAGRARLTRQFLVEGLLLSAGGAGLGLLLARLSTRLMVVLAGESIPRVDGVALDGQVLTVTAGVSVLTAIGFGLLSARRASRPNLAATLREGERGSSGGRRSRRARSAFVASEVALSIVLLVGAGLMIRSFVALRAVDPGFVPDRVLSLVMSVTGSAESPPGRRTAFYQTVVARVAALPGVEAVSAINHLPLAGDIWGFPFVIEGRPKPKPGETPVAIYRITLPGYFKTMQLTLIRGRDFTDADTVGTPGVMIVNEFLARTHFPGEDAIGRRIRLDTDTFTIVGIAKDAVRGDWASPAEEEVYIPYLQSLAHRESPEPQRAYMTLVVRTAGDPSALVPAVRGEIRATARDVTISEVLALRDVVAQATDGTRFVLVLLGVFAGVALVLAAIGIHGVMSFVVSGRRREIGIRMALGATPAQVLAGVVRDGMVMAAVGAAAGIAGVFLLSQSAAGLVYGVSATDALTVSLSTLCLIAVAMVACYVPARRASRVDPLQELR